MRTHPTRRDAFRLGAGALTATAGVASLAACSNGSGGGSDTISLWNFFGPSPDGTAVSDWITQLAEDWNASHDVTVELRYIPNQTYMDGTTLQTAFTSGEGPDLFVISPGDFLRFANGGALLDLSDAIPEQIRSDFAPGFLEARSDGDEILAVPFDAEPLAMYYSVEAFEDAGLSEGDIPETWDQFLDIADKLTTDSRFGALVEPAPSYYQNFTWYPFVWQSGQEFFDDSGNPTFDSPGVHAALQFWQDLVGNGLSPRQAQGTGSNEANTNLGAGTVAMQLSGIWSIAQLEQNVPDFEYGVFQLPIPDGGDRVTDVGGWAMAANADGANTEAAAEFIAWAYASDDAEQIDRLVNWNAGAKSNLPTRDSVVDAANDQDAYSEGMLQYFVDEVYPTGRPEPRFPPEVYRPISDAIQNAMMNGEDPETAAARAQEDLEAFIENYNGVPIEY
ncbi:MAG: sugar ABC transporter substrate-binding protein [Brachybacterium sp.]|nr:sugar ABC transporter substrate-binding protein [Brachybacterium sp.]